jgi:hypothetical protein
MSHQLFILLSVIFLCLFLVCVVKCEDIREIVSECWFVNHAQNKVTLKNHPVQYVCICNFR